MHNAPVIAAHDLVKRYGRHEALRGIDLQVQPASLYGLAGPNGSGKSTLAKILSGALVPDRGFLFVTGKPVTAYTTRALSGAGIVAIHQNSTLLPSLTTAEQLELGVPGDVKLPNAIREVRSNLQLRIDLTKPAEALNGADRLFLFAYRAFGWSPRLVILDEATAGVSAESKEDFYGAISPFVNGGGSILIVSHDLDELVGRCSTVVGMKEGKLVCVLPNQGDVATFRSAVFGDSRPAVPVAPAPITRAQSTHSVELAIADAHIHVRSGESTELSADAADALLRRRHVRSRTDERLTIDGNAYSVWDGSDLRRHRIAWVTNHEDLFPTLTIAENLGVLSLDTVARWGVLSRRALQDNARQLIASYSITPNDIDPAQPVSYLSGGNQQKVLLARELSFARTALVTSHPTRGLDEPSKSVIFDRIKHAVRQNGLAHLFVSSDDNERKELKGELETKKGEDEA